MFRWEGGVLDGGKVSGIKTLSASGLETTEAKWWVGSKWGELVEGSDTSEGIDVEKMTENQRMNFMVTKLKNKKCHIDHFP